MQAFAQKWFRLDPRVRHELPQGNTQNLMHVDVPAVSHCVERIVDALHGGGAHRHRGPSVVALPGRHRCLVGLGADGADGCHVLKVHRARNRPNGRPTCCVARDQAAWICCRRNSLTAIKVIKLSGWSDVFLGRTRRARSAEVDRLISVMLLQTRSSLVFSCAGLVVATATYGLHILRKGAS
jgi:hypothetical protein